MKHIISLVIGMGGAYMGIELNQSPLLSWWAGAITAMLISINFLIFESE